MIKYEEKDQNPQSTEAPPKIKFGSGFHSFQCFTHEQVKEINKTIDKNIFKKNIFKEQPAHMAAQGVSKKGEFFHIPCSLLLELLHPWLYQCQIINKEKIGYDIDWDFHVDALTYNVYDSKKQGEYDWHIDYNFCIMSDIKLTCLLNLSEEPYEGGEFHMINSKENIKFTSGMAVVFNSLIAHKVTPVTKGERITLTFWAHGPSWR